MSLPMYCTYYNVTSMDELKLSAVFLRFKKGITVSEIQTIQNAFRAAIPGVTVQREGGIVQSDGDDGLSSADLLL